MVYVLSPHFLQSILGSEMHQEREDNQCADLTPEPKDYSVNARGMNVGDESEPRDRDDEVMDESELADRGENREEGQEGSAPRADAEKENLDSNVGSVKSEFDMDEYDEE